ncbi:MAG: aldehyde dehydrogenase family protein, partial [Spirochaetales bacterium]|nr:aldehyde dehydrogenase family protein [Spirochaetales bacterium]
AIGIISEDVDLAIIEIAKPIGIVGAVQPCTKPIVPPMANAMAALKGRNTIIIAPHPRAVYCTKFLIDEWNKLLKKHNAPENIIQCVEDINIERSRLLMEMTDVSVATGGPGMVKAAYSSGKPSFGVGPGNVQCIIDRGVDIKKAVEIIVGGRIFDNGIICSAEQTIIIPEEIYDKVINELKLNEGYIVENQKEREILIDVLFPEGKLNRKLIGQEVQAIAKTAGIEMPGNTKVIVIPEEASNKDSLLRKEKMFPVITPFKYKKFGEAIDIALENLDIEGKGHSIVIHSENKDHILELAEKAPVSRVLVNQPCSSTIGGSFSNGLNPTSTLGCGSWGNNSISENFYYKHLLNITRIANIKKNCVIPTDEELWAEEE